MNIRTSVTYKFRKAEDKRDKMSAAFTRLEVVEVTSVCHLSSLHRFLELGVSCKTLDWTACDNI